MRTIRIDRFGLVVSQVRSTDPTPLLSSFLPDICQTRTTPSELQISLCRTKGEIVNSDSNVLTAKSR